MRRLRALLVLASLAFAPGCVVAGGVTPVHGGYYGGGYGYAAPRPYYPPPRFYAPRPVYRPYYPPPRAYWGHGVGRGYSQGHGSGHGRHYWR